MLQSVAEAKQVSYFGNAVYIAGVIRFQLSLHCLFWTTHVPGLLVVLLILFSSLKESTSMTAHINFISSILAFLFYLINSYSEGFSCDD